MWKHIFASESTDFIFRINTAIKSFLLRQEDPLKMDFLTMMGFWRMILNFEKFNDSVFPIFKLRYLWIKWLNFLNQNFVRQLYGFRQLFEYNVFLSFLCIGTMVSWKWLKLQLNDFFRYFSKLAGRVSGINISTDIILSMKVFLRI